MQTRSRSVTPRNSTKFTALTALAQFIKCRRVAMVCIEFGILSYLIYTFNYINDTSPKNFFLNRLDALYDLVTHLVTADKGCAF